MPIFKVTATQEVRTTWVVYVEADSAEEADRSRNGIEDWLAGLGQAAVA